MKFYKSFGFKLVCFFSVTFFFQNKINGQQYFETSGTLVVGAKCSDGAILIADSRVSVVLSNHSPDSPAAYFDKMPKIYIEKKIAFGTRGTRSTGEIDYAALVISNYKTCQSYGDLDTVVNCLIALNKASNSFNTFRNNFTFFMSAFSGKTELILTDNRSTFTFLAGFYGTSQDFKRFVELENKVVFDSLNRSQYTCQKASNLLQNFMRLYIKKNKLDWHIGGPFSVLKVTPTNKFIWLQNDFTKNNIPPNEIMPRIKSGKLQVTYTWPGAEQELLRSR
ncbi:hypothetical protein [Pollutibacter soli]|uniref:hypothetical protein n=1 Tax=Pollutibacter soli TaxID=3034157 RepID=UPI0030140808